MATRPDSALEDRPRLRITRRYPVAPEKVWRAWTDPQALSQWFGPGEVNSVTLAELDRRCTRFDGQFTVLGAVQNVIFEEWAHHVYATRDLARLPVPDPPPHTSPGGRHEPTFAQRMIGRPSNVVPLATHAPEQQSASVRQRSSCTRQPPRN